MILDKAIQQIQSNLACSLFVFDLETTNVNKNTAEIVQFAGVLIPLKGKSQSIEFLCKPVNSIEKGAEEVHGISNDSLKDEKPFSAYAGKISKMIQGADFAGFNNARFDCPIFYREMSNAGFSVDEEKHRVYDAYSVYIKHSARKLANALQHYCNEEIEDAHDALGDVNTTCKIIASQLAQEGLNTHAVIDKFKPKDEEERILARFIETKDGVEFLNFSKHKGKKCNEIDSGFWRWILKSDFPQCLQAKANFYANQK